MTLIPCRSVRGGKKLTGCRLSPAPMILLPAGEWPCDHPTLDHAGQDQPRLRGPGKPPLVQGRDGAVGPASGPAFGSKIVGVSSGPSAAISSLEDNLGGLHMPELMTASLRESSVAAQALQDALREIGRAAEPGMTVEVLWPS